MKTQDPHNDDHTRKLFATLGVEEPSADFAASLMQQIYAEAARSQIVYQPLISRRTVLLIVTGLLLLLGAVGYYAWRTGSMADPEAAPGREIFSFLNHLVSWTMDSLPLLQNIFQLAMGLVVFWLLLLTDRLLAGSDPERVA